MSSENGDDGGDYMVMTKSTSYTTGSSTPSSQLYAQRPLSVAATAVECHVIPTEVDCNGSTTVVLIFDRDVMGRVDAFLIDQTSQRAVRTSALAGGQQQLQPAVTRVNNRTFTFRAPEHREGTVDLLLTVDGRQLASRCRLTYESPSLRLGRGLSTLYVRQLDAMCQHIIDIQSRQTSASASCNELDRLLATALADGETDVPVHVYEDLFGIYRLQATSAADVTDQDFSVSLTLLHLAAKYGFTTFSDRLIDLPDSAQAASLCRNRDGKTPTELARWAGFATLGDRLSRLVINGSDSAIDRLNRKMSGADMTPISAPIIHPLQPRSSTVVQPRSSTVPYHLVENDHPSLPPRAVMDRQYSNQVSRPDSDDDYVFGSGDDVTADRQQDGPKSTSSQDSGVRAAQKPSAVTIATDRLPSTRMQRKASYSAATADDILLFEENKTSVSSADANDDLPLPAFRPPPPPVNDSRRNYGGSGTSQRNSVDAPQAGTDGNPPTAAARRSALARSVAPREKSDISRTSPPPVAPRSTVHLPSSTGSGMPAAFAALAAQQQKQQSAVMLRTQPASTTSARELSTDEVACQLDKVVPAPRARPKTSRT